jgi:hypothetical protein
MRRIAIVLAGLTLAASGVVPAQAATKATIVTAAFNALLNQSATSLEALEEQYEADVDALDSALADATRFANATYDTEFSAATLLYSPQISAINLKITEAKAKFVSVSSLKVLSLGTNRNYWGNLDCPSTRLDCKDPGDKGEKFNVGETTKVKEFLSTNYTEYLPEIDIMVSQGLTEAPWQKSLHQTTAGAMPSETKQKAKEFLPPPPKSYILVKH